MVKRLIALPVAMAVLLVPGLRQAPRAAEETVLPLLTTLERQDICLMPPAAPAYQATRGALQAGQDQGGPLAPGWPGKTALGGNVQAARVVADPHPTFNGMAIDPQNNVVVISDENRSSVLVYDLKAGGSSKETTPPRNRIIGEKAELGFLAGVTLDPVHRELFTVNNDGGGLVVHSYDANGNVKPIRTLRVPHQTWGLSLDMTNDEIAVSSQQYQGITIYKRTAVKAERPLRAIRGEHTQLADPHGVVLDGKNDELFTANHGNWTEMRTYSADGPPLLVGEYKPGRFESPSIRVYKGSANGDVPPIRTIQGKNTRLAWPMGIAVDDEAGELLVTNYSTNEILVYKKTANGDTAPIRALGGDKTGIIGPIAVQVDRKNNELWVANYGDHTALVFDLRASGNVAPKRIIRNAPAGTPTTGFTNASAAAYDSKRDQILVPN